MTHPTQEWFWVPQSPRCLSPYCRDFESGCPGVCDSGNLVDEGEKSLPWREDRINAAHTRRLPLLAFHSRVRACKNKHQGETARPSAKHQKIYAGGIDLHFTIDALLEQTEGFLQQGFRAIKMKVGRDRLSEDVERVAAMRQTLGADFPLLVDANMRWRVDQAIRAAQALRPYDLYWLEEPIIPDDIAGHARIAQEGGLPLATGENLHSIYEFQHLMQHGCIAFPEPDVATVGGITPWRKIAHMAEALHLPITTHGVHDLQVHLLAAIPNASYLEIHGFGLDRFLLQPLTLVAGEAMAPDRPGHGVQFDWQALAPHRQ